MLNYKKKKIRLKVKKSAVKVLKFGLNKFYGLNITLHNVLRIG
jgi:hypothetical protein